MDQHFCKSKNRAGLPATFTHETSPTPSTGTLRVKGPRGTEAHLSPHPAPVSSSVEHEGPG